MKWSQSSTTSCSEHQPQQRKVEDNNLAQWVKHPSLGKIRLETQETKLMSYCYDFQGPSVSATASQSHS